MSRAAPPARADSSAPAAPIAPVRRLVRRLGVASLALAALTVGPAVLLMATGDSRFSFATFLSELGGADEPWVRTFFNAGLLLLAPVRLGFLLGVAWLARRDGVRTGFVRVLVASAVASALGLAGVGAVQHTLSLVVHSAFATLYYGGWVVASALIATVAIRRGAPAWQWAADAAVAISCAVFLGLTAAGFRLGGPGPAWPAAYAEWVAFAALLAWIVTHIAVPFPGTATGAVRWDARRASHDVGHPQPA